MRVPRNSWAHHLSTHPCIHPSIISINQAGTMAYHSMGPIVSSDPHGGPVDDVYGVRASDGLLMIIPGVLSESWCHVQLPPSRTLTDTALNKSQVRWKHSTASAHSSFLSEAPADSRSEVHLPPVHPSASSAAHKFPRPLGSLAARSPTMNPPWCLTCTSETNTNLQIQSELFPPWPFFRTSP